MFHGSCRKVSKVLRIALEPISKSAVHYLAKRISEIRVSKEPRYRRCIAVDETATCQEILRIHMVCSRRRFKEIIGSRGLLW